MAFWQLVVPASPEASEGLTNFLWEQGALGVVEEESPGCPPRLRAFFPDSASSTGLVASVTTYAAGLLALGFDVAPGEVEISPLVEEAWASAWQQSFPPRPIGRRLWVRPSWESAEAPGRLTVIIEPGRAFGTGHHGSTEGCLVLLDEALADRPPALLLDIGTGTGILAVAALKLGVERVLGLDIDPDAIAAARCNAERNDCADRLDLLLAGPELLQDRPPFRLVVANILAHTHQALAPRYGRLVAPGGRLILGGILEHEDDLVVTALYRAAFSLERRLVIEGWSSLLFTAAAA
jgi:ribosomal protein L11 methyltransferase